MITRRGLALGSLGVMLGTGALQLLRARTAQSATAKFEVEHTDAEWRKLLSPAQYTVLRRQGTEAPGSSPLEAENRKGVYDCAGCALRALFFGDEIPQRHRLALLLCAARGRGRDVRGPEPHDGAHGSALPPLRWPFGPCLQRRPAAHGAPLLHERRGARLQARHGLREKTMRARMLGQIAALASLLAVGSAAAGAPAPPPPPMPSPSSPAAASGRWKKPSTRPKASSRPCRAIAAAR